MSVCLSLNTSKTAYEFFFGILHEVVDLESKKGTQLKFKKNLNLGIRGLNVKNLFFFWHFILNHALKVSHFSHDGKKQLRRLS